MLPPDARLTLLDDLRRKERRAAVSRVASVIGHLIGTPLNVIAGRAALIRANPAAPSAQENARRIEQQVEQLARRVRTLIEYLTLDDTETELSDARQVIDDAMALYEPIAAARNVELVLQPSNVGSARLEANSALIVLTTLLSLATTAAPAGTRVVLNVKSLPGSVVFELTVPGLDAPRTRIDRLDPPEDARDAAGAERLQVLSVCHAIAGRQGGRLEVDATVPAVVRLVLASA